MTTTEFRRMALSLPEAIESSHMDHPDFRVAGKIFATLGYPARGWGMVKLTPQQQTDIVRDFPEAFVPVNGAWGRRGATTVHLRSVTKKILQQALATAWTNTAPKRLTASVQAQTI